MQRITWSAVTACFLPGVVNDVGIVYGPSGPFVVAVLFDGTSDEGEAARSTADVALIAYRRFNS